MSYEFLLNASPAGYLVFAIVGTMLFLPGSVTMTLAGFLFGFMPGVLWAGIAVPIGAQGAFEVGRRVARPWVQRRLSGSSQLRALETGLREEGFIIVFLSRLSLVVPFNLLNYMSGASSIKAPTYFVATMLGMIPPILLYVYLGTLARDLGEILSGKSTPSELSVWLLVTGVVFLIAVIVVIRRAANRALEKQLSHSKEARPVV